MARQFVSGVVYFLIFAHIVGGLTGIIRRDPPNNNWSDEHDFRALNRTTGVVSIILGLFLLLGVVMDNHQIVFAHMCLTTVGLIFGVEFLLTFPIYADALNIILLVVSGAFQYCIYLYYADLKKRNLNLRQQGNLSQENDNHHSVTDDIEQGL